MIKITITVVSGFDNFQQLTLMKGCDDLHQYNTVPNIFTTPLYWSDLVIYLPYFKSSAQFFSSSKKPKTLCGW